MGTSVVLEQFGPFRVLAHIKIIKIHMWRMLNNSHSSTLKPSIDIHKMFALCVPADVFLRKKNSVRVDQFRENKAETTIIWEIQNSSTRATTKGHSVRPQPLN